MSENDIETMAQIELLRRKMYSLANKLESNNSPVECLKDDIHRLWSRLTQVANRNPKWKMRADELEG